MTYNIGWLVEGGWLRVVDWGVVARLGVVL